MTKEKLEKQLEFYESVYGIFEAEGKDILYDSSGNIKLYLEMKFGAEKAGKISEAARLVDKAFEDVYDDLNQKMDYLSSTLDV